MREPVGRAVHVEGLVRPVVVVVGDERLHGGLSLCEGRERLVMVEQLSAQGLVESLHLARGGREAAAVSR
jgi:hypothetical protein